MIKKNMKSRKVRWIWHVVLVGMVIAASLSLASDKRAETDAKDPNIPKSLLDRTAPSVRGQILKATMQPFEPSLEMKENVDFLLTPALLVQQAISENIVITYPSE